jgi:arginyl-tRNA synthetase
MNLFSAFRSKIIGVLQGLQGEGVLPEGLAFDAVDATAPRDPSHGDMATNAAMVLAAKAGKNPKELAGIIAVRLRVLEHVDTVEIAGPGFLNVRFAPAFWHSVIAVILNQGIAFGTSDAGKGQKVNVEYVSANPTGPMHVGHVRGAVLGDALASLLKKAGFDVTREYYFNDAGAQIDVLTQTAYLRYREACGEAIGDIPQGLYPGEYMKDVAAALLKRDGRKWLEADEKEWFLPVKQFAVDTMIRMIREDLDLIGIHHDVFSNERVLIEDGTLEKAFDILNGKGLIYTGTLPPPRGKAMEDWEPAELTLFRSSQFGDSTDRPLKKRDGSWAYIMPDIAYHYDKIRRGFTLMINVLGMDHGGYLERMQPVVAAFGDGKATLKVIFNAIVKVYKNGEPVKLSKRSGNLITLREMVEQVGPGAVRFFMLTRDSKSQLDFDFAKVVEQSKDNPVFYVQYAHARCHSVLRTAQEQEGVAWAFSESPSPEQLLLLTAPAEMELIRLLAAWPRTVESAALAYEPHRVAFYLHDVAAAFHGVWNSGNSENTLRFLQKDAIDLTAARLSLVRACVIVIASGLTLLGVEPLKEMR